MKINFGTKKLKIDVENNIRSWTNAQLWLGTNIEISIGGSIRVLPLLHPFYAASHLLHMYQGKTHNDHLSLPALAPFLRNLTAPAPCIREKTHNDHLVPFGWSQKPACSAFFFQPEQHFSLTTIQPEQCFQPNSAQRMGPYQIEKIWAPSNLYTLA